jgi:hypothetical protein
MLLRFILIAIVFAAILAIGAIAYNILIPLEMEHDRRKKIQRYNDTGILDEYTSFPGYKNDVARQKGIVDKLNTARPIQALGFKLSGNTKLQKIFNRAKNPWNMTIPTFQFIRYGGGILFTAIAAFFYFVIGNSDIAMFSLSFAGIAVFYPTYYYKATGNEREAQWNKFYEFIWVVKSNAAKYDPAKVFLETRKYIEKHAPHNKEIIQGFQDFYDNWDDNKVPPYVKRYYDFPVPKEIYQVLFNMHKTGEYPENELANLRKFIIQQQDLTVLNKLSGVEGQATIASLPFLMASVIAGMLVPLIMQIVAFL